MNENKPVHKISGLEYTEKDDLGQFPILVIEQRRHVPTIRVFADKKGELFVMLYGVAGNCGFSSWTNQPFVGAIRRLGVDIYRNADNGAFAVNINDVATIAEELLTLPREESLVTVDNAFAIITNKTNKFLDWWNNKALAAIEKQARRAQSPEKTLPPIEPAESVDKKKEELPMTELEKKANEEISWNGHIGGELKWLEWNIKRLIRAGLSTELAIKTAINLRKECGLYRDATAEKKAIAMIVDFIKLINPNVEVDER